MSEKKNLSARKIVGLSLAAVATVVVLASLGSLFENVKSQEIIVMQDPIDGDLHFWTDQGLKWQKWGSIRRYVKSSHYEFSKRQEGDDSSIKVRFNDGGHGLVSGSLRFDLPLDKQHLETLHKKFGSQEAIEQTLIRPIVERSVYMSGPLMSSKESTAERRSDLIQYIEDQVTHGVYQTLTEEEKVVDPLSGKEKTISRVKLVKKEGAPNGIARQERSPLEEFGIRAYNFTIDGVKYAKEVEAQIQQQQRMTMQVQTAMAKAKEAQQKAITAAKEGEAEATKAKWEQEVLKATAVTKAEQDKAVAELAVQTAELRKREQMLLGEGEAARKKAVMLADGALDKKLATYKEVMLAFAQEIGKQQWVPNVQIGTGSGKGEPAAALMQMWQAKVANELALDLRVKGK